MPCCHYEKIQTLTSIQIDFATYTLTAGVSLSSNNSYAIRYGKIGLLFLSCRTSSNIASESQVTLFTGDMALESPATVSVPKIGVQSTLSITMTTNGNVTAYSHSNSYGNWIRAVIPFVADV